MRYYSALIVWDVVFMFSFFERYINTEKIKSISKSWVVGFVSFSSMIIFFTFRLFKGGLVENTLLKFYNQLASKMEVINNNLGSFSVNYYEIALKLIFVLFIVILSVLLFKNKKVFPVMFTLVAVSNFLLHTKATMNEFKFTYGTFFKEERVSEIEILEKFFSEDNSKVLMITKGFDKVLNTFYHKNSYWVFEDTIKENYLNTGMIDFSKDSIRAQYPHNIYQNLDKVDYVVLSSISDLKILNGKKVEIEGLKFYEIYQVNDRELFIDDKKVIPERVGSKKELSTKVLLTQHTIEGDSFISTHIGDAMCYGPYQMITKGTYQISFDYTTKGENISPILIVQVKTKNESLFLYTIEENIGSFKFEFVVEKDLENFEFILTPYFEGIEVKDIIITKLED